MTKSQYVPPKTLLQDNVILVTGASEGIGKVLALTFAEYGANLVLMARNADKLSQLADKIKANGYHEPMVIAMDFESTDIKSYEEKAAQVEKVYGRLDGLVHNAGILGEITTIENYSPDLWQKVMQVNFYSEFLLTKAFLSLLNKSHSASVLFTSSSVGNKGRAKWGAYSVSKFATEGFAQVLADEAKDSNNRLRVNIINPGRMRTAMRATAYPKENPETLQTPQAIMPVYLYLMGKDSKTLNGERINAQNWQWD